MGDGANNLQSVRRIAVIGAGFSGTMTAAQLARGSMGPLEVTLIDRSGRFGLGIAYGTTDEAHLLNVRAAGMTAWPETPEHFLNWARQEQAGLTGEEYMPRPLYGRYVTEQLAKESARPGFRLERLAAEVQALDSGPQGLGLRAIDHEGRTVERVYDAAVLALGNDPSTFLTRAFPALATAPDRVVSPWDGQRLRALPRQAPVALVGTGLTAVDALMSLEAGGHLGPVAAVSRHGLLPAGHRLASAPVSAEARAAIDEAMREIAAAKPGSLATGKVVREVRQALANATRLAPSWHLAFDLLRPWTVALWSALDPASQRRFLRHIRRYWDMHRHRMAPQSKTRIDAMRQQGRLVVLAGRVEAVERTGTGGFNVQVRRRTTQQLQALSADYLIDCTGIDRDVRASKEPLIRGLISSGLAEPDALGLGFRTDAVGRLVGGSRQPLYTLGPWRRGELWESVAVPELRGQAQAVAGGLLQDLGDLSVQG